MLGCNIDIEDLKWSAVIIMMFDAVRRPERRLLHRPGFSGGSSSSWDVSTSGEQSVSQSVSE